MSLVLLQNAKAIAVSRPVPFGGYGGTAPYTYEVLVPGGVGGAIDPTTGRYVAPNRLGTDTIQVRDADGNTARAKITVMDPIQLVCDIIRTGMGLSQNQVFLWDQQFNVPNDPLIYIAVSVLTPKVFGNVRKYNDGVVGQAVNIATTIGVDIMSYSYEAVLRKEEVLMALQSDYSQRQQQLNSFSVFAYTNQFVNLSFEDGPSIPYRFNLTLAMQYFVSKNGVSEYYDSFSQPLIVTDPATPEE